MSISFVQSLSVLLLFLMQSASTAVSNNGFWLAVKAHPVRVRSSTGIEKLKNGISLPATKIMASFPEVPRWHWQEMDPNY